MTLARKVKFCSVQKVPPATQEVYGNTNMNVCEMRVWLGACSSIGHSLIFRPTFIHLQAHSTDKGPHIPSYTKH